MNSVEFSIGVRCMNWADDYFAMRWPEYLISQFDRNGVFQKKVSPFVHVTNEGKMSGKRGYGTNQLGRKKGFPDYELPISRGQYGALYLELKRPDVKAKGDPLTDANQKEWRRFLENDNCHRVVQSVQEFCDTTIWYMELGS